MGPYIAGFGMDPENRFEALFERWDLWSMSAMQEIVVFQPFGQVVKMGLFPNIV